MKSTYLEIVMEDSVRELILEINDSHGHSISTLKQQGKIGGNYFFSEFGPFKKLERARILSAVPWGSWLSKTCSNSKSGVSRFKNSRDSYMHFIFGLFSKTVQETYLLIRVRPQSYLYPQNKWFWWRRFLQFVTRDRSSLWQEMEAPQLAIMKETLSPLMSTHVK